MAAYPVRLYAAFPARAESGGNMAGIVYLDGTVADRALADMAADLAAPTTGFVGPPGDRGFPVRFFSGRGEMDMCGHVCLAIANALLADGRTDRGGAVILDTPAGPRTLLPDSTEPDMFWLEQPLPTREPAPASVAALTAILGVPGERLRSLACLSGGLRHLLVEVDAVDTLSTLAVSDEAARRFCRDHGIGTIGVWSSGTGSGCLRLRDFCHGVGDPEEAASGTTTAALAAHVLSRRPLPTGEPRTYRLEVGQGVEMGRPSRLLAQVRVSDGRLDRILVGGTARRRLKGRIVA